MVSGIKMNILEMAAFDWNKTMMVLIAMEFVVAFLVERIGRSFSSRMKVHFFPPVQGQVFFSFFFFKSNLDAAIKNQCEFKT